MEITITREDLRALGEISCIEIPEHEVEPMIQELRAVLMYVSSLKEVASTTADEIELVRPVNVVRSDTIKLFDAAILLDNAPEQENNFFVVPVIVKQS